MYSYRDAGGTLDAPEEFVRLLARTGVVCSVIGWLVRLADDRAGGDYARAETRLGRLVARVELFRGF